MKQYIILILLVLFAPFLGAVPLTLVWPDQPPNTPEVDGYRIYQVIKTQASPTEPEVITYQQVNTVKIAKEARQFTIENAPSGATYTIRAYNAGGEGPDSVHFTMPAPPAQVPGLDALKLTVEASPNLMTWGAIAVINVDKSPKSHFYRLSW